MFKHNFNHFSPVISFIIIMSILIMQNKFLCDGIHTRTQSVMHLHPHWQGLYYHGLSFYIYISIISSGTRTSKSLAIRFYLLVLFSHWFNYSFFLASVFSFWLLLAYWLFKAFHWLTRVLCSDNKNGFFICFWFFFMFKSSFCQSFYCSCNWLCVIYYFQAIQLFRLKNHYISFLVDG